MIGRTNAGGGGGASWDNAVIHIYAPAGSVITSTKGGVTKPVKEHIILGQASEYFFYVKPADFGEWTISASHTWFGTSDKTVSVALNLEYIVKFGIHVPWDYQEVEFIEGYGQQYINTNLSVPCQNLLVTGVFLENTITETHHIFGTSISQPSAGEQFCVDNYYSSSLKMLEGWMSAVAGIEIRKPNIANTILTIDAFFSLSENYFSLDGTKVFSGAGTSETNLKNIQIFNEFDNAYRVGKFGKFKLYALYGTISGEYAFNFVPCYKKSNNVVGLYETVSGTFYTNNGSGAFGAGGDVA